MDAHHPQRPHHTKNMVGMGMGDEYSRQISKTDSGLPELRQNAIASPAVDKQAVAAHRQHKASIVTFSHRGMSRAKHEQACATIFVYVHFLQ